MVYSTCHRVLHNASDAEEVAQDCFEALASGRAKPTAALGPWLHRVATNRALKRLSSDKHRRAREKAYRCDLLECVRYTLPVQFTVAPREGGYRAKSRFGSQLKWRARADLNRRPLAPEASALSTELRARVFDSSHNTT